MSRVCRLFVLLASLLTANLAVPFLISDLRADPNWQVKIHFLHPDGHVEERLVEGFRFVFFERRYVRRAGEGEAKTKVVIKDRERERYWVQNHELRKVRFHKIRRIDFLYQGDDGQKSLFLKIERRRKNERKKLKIEEWQASQLRNAGNAPTPLFRGLVNGDIVDFPLPPMAEPVTPTEPRMIAIDFDFPGVKIPRKLF